MAAGPHDMTTLDVLILWLTTGNNYIKWRQGSCSKKDIGEIVLVYLAQNGNPGLLSAMCQYQVCLLLWLFLASTLVWSLPTLSPIYLSPCCLCCPSFLSLFIPSMALSLTSFGCICTKSFFLLAIQNKKLEKKFRDVCNWLQGTGQRLLKDDSTQGILVKGWLGIIWCNCVTMLILFFWLFQHFFFFFW